MRAGESTVGLSPAREDQSEKRVRRQRRRYVRWCKLCGVQFAYLTRGGRTPDYCSEDCRRVIDRDRKRKVRAR